jgi:hypothetical protein
MNDALINIMHQLIRQLNPDQRMILKHVFNDCEAMEYFKNRLDIQISNDAKEFTFT